MSRYHPDHSLEPILNAVSLWKERAFGPNKSLFSDTCQCWTVPCFNELVTHFVDNPSEIDKNFWEKLEIQLTPASKEARLLMSELIWLLLLFPSQKTRKASTKREQVISVFNFAGTGEEIPAEYLTNEVLSGIGSCGQAFQTGFWREVNFTINLFKSLLEKPDAYRTTLLSDPWNWGEWLVGLTESENRQFRHMISYLLFPDHYESYASLEEKRKILIAFKGVPETEIKNMKLVVLDQHLYELRQDLENEYGTSELVYYKEPLFSRWKMEDTAPLKLFLDQLVDRISKQTDFKIGKQAQEWVWLHLFKDSTVLPMSIAHYEVIVRKGLLCVELHFENAKFNNKFHVEAVLGVLPEQFEYFGKSNSIRVKGGLQIAEESIDPIIEKLTLLDNVVGDTIRNSVKQAVPNQDRVIGLVDATANAWLDDCISGVSEHSKYLISWNWSPTGTIETIEELRKRIHEAGSFHFYCAQNGFADHRLAITDIAVRGTFQQKKWQDIPGYSNALKKFEDVSQNSFTAFLVEAVTTLEKPISVKDFVYWRNYKVPRANLQPFVGFVGDFGIIDQEDDVTQEVLESAKNIILFGPPGTGKTYELLNKWVPKYRSVTRSAQERHADALREFVSTATWWEAILFVMVDIGGTTIQVSQIHEHPVLQMKASLSSNKNVKATLWGNLQMHARIDSKTVNYTQRQSPAIFDKNDDATWVVLDNWRDIVPDSAERIDEIKSSESASDEVIQRSKFITFHQSYGYEEFIEGLRPITNEDGQISYEVTPGVFQQICNQAKLDPDNRYAIFIDEINRGNISKIFGELITLIETDKRVRYDRSGKAIPGGTGIEITLPYSGKSFGVPANLDIIGTMNTADRSIALLDVALRRRFDFKELMPDETAISGSDGTGTIENGTVDLRKLLSKLNKRIRLLAGRELQLGHAFFCSVNTLADLQLCFANKIVPLLQEYFYGHWERIQLVLGDRPDQLTEEERADRKSYCFVLNETLDEIDILGYDHDDHDNREDFYVNNQLLLGTLSSQAFTKIYRTKQ